ncbi:MAG: hypothetical protein ISR65_05300 [Bacteriovoracaceae bacterium]|nr:hypothetical protein [Bacteriovoracaceae bacterium]
MNIKPLFPLPHPSETGKTSGENTQVKFIDEETRRDFTKSDKQMVIIEEPEDTEIVEEIEEKKRVVKKVSPKQSKIKKILKLLNIIS